MTLTQRWTGPVRALALTAAGVALVTVGAAAGQMERPRGDRAMRGMPFAQLNLTEDQQTRIKAIFEEQRSTRADGREALRKAHDELRAAIFSSAPPDTAQVDALVARVAELEASALRDRVAAELKVSAILTDEQRQQLATMKPGRRPGAGRGPGGPAR